MSVRPWNVDDDEQRPNALDPSTVRPTNDLWSDITPIFTNREPPPSQRRRTTINWEEVLQPFVGEPGRWGYYECGNYKEAKRMHNVLPRALERAGGSWDYAVRGSDLWLRFNGPYK
jgi:hypothetical protein